MLSTGVPGRGGGGAGGGKRNANEDWVHAWCSQNKS